MKAPTHDHGQRAVPSDLTLRVKALESLLVEKGLVDSAALDALIATRVLCALRRERGVGRPGRAVRRGSCRYVGRLP